MGGGFLLPPPIALFPPNMIFIKDQLQPNLWQIHEPWFSEHANLYIIQGSKKTLLIDTGLGLEHLPSWLKSQGIVPDIVVTTHAHFDHCGGLHQFPTDCIFLTPAQAANIQKPELWGLRYLKSDQFAPSCCHIQHVKDYKPVAPKSWNALGNEIDLGNYKLSVIEMPGHTDDSVVFFEKESGWLFSGDILYRGKLYGDFPNADISKWQKALQKVASLTPNIIFPGHNELFNGLKLSIIIGESLKQLQDIKPLSFR